MGYTAPAAVSSGAVISKTTFGDVVIADLNFLANPPACRVYHNANQSISDNSETTVAFNSERYDTDAMHDTVTNNSRITIKTAGLYVVSFTGIFPGLTTYSMLYAYIRLNGATIVDLHQITPSTFSSNLTLKLNTTYKFAVNDYIEVRVFQDNTASSAQNLTSTGNYSPEFTATWVGLG